MKKIFICALAALAFAACSKEGGDPNRGNQLFDGEEAWVTMSLNDGVGVLSSRALGTPLTDDGTTDEQEINEIRAIFFDAAKKVTKDMVLTAAQMGTVGKPNSGAAAVAGDPFKVPSTSKSVLLIANAPAGYPASFAASTSYATVNAALTNTVAQVGTPKASGGKGFMMSNARGDVEAVTPHATEAEANAAPAKINLDRVLAKVRVIATSPSSDVAGVTIGNVGWRLNVTNKKFYPASERTKTYMETTSRGCISPMDIFTPKRGSYRKDPNYNNSTFPFTTPAASTAYNAEYDYFTDADYTGITWNNATASLYEYCHENTQEAAYNYHAWTTHALISAKYTPSLFWLPTDGSTPTGRMTPQTTAIGSRSRIHSTPTRACWCGSGRN